MTLKYVVTDHIGVEGVTYHVEIKVSYNNRFKHGDYYKRAEMRKNIGRRLEQEIDFGSVSGEIEKIISEEVTK